MAEEWFEGHVASIRKRVAGYKNADSSLPQEYAPLALSFAALRRLERLEIQFNEMAEKQDKILEILERLDNPPAKKGRSIDPRTSKSA